ncbi:transcriptional regulator, TetR family [Haloechinothrix alba]|uniref:Transcriptional regulator, TetR family n=1 Tax=Haloechinothrix alba TaxID=664784 RepID=A0A239A459_9PSEU|nr:TetR/AcrR family transcriptional regulator [Haloechinothrix alba]SNR90081.1 transcriptional regulator, TetR family [Haloechinothrix alba]
MARRTQAERRAATRLALMEATVVCVVESGYGNVTSGQIATRAGVTRGAQNYHFAGKAELVAAALEHMMNQLVDEIRADPPGGDTPTDRAVALLDRLWALHDTPGFKAAMEIGIASRTDEELRGHVEDLNRKVIGAVAEVVGEVLPEVTGHPDLVPVMLTVLAAVRGVAVVGLISSEEAVESLWQTVRGQLVRYVSASVDNAIAGTAS